MEKRVYYHDTDAGGVVYYGNYLKFLEEARTEFLENRGLSVAVFHEKGYEYVVRKCAVLYRRPARYGDILTCDAKLKTITPAQLIFEQKISNRETGELLVEAEVSLACVRARDFKPTQIPEDIRVSLS